MADKKRSSLDFDEINKLEYEDYFDEMDIEDDALKERVKAAVALDNRVGATLAWIERTRPSVRAMYNRLYEAYMDMLDDIDAEDEEYLEERAIQFAEEVTKSTNNHSPDGYWTSADRAAEIAKNESAIVNNHREFEEAKRRGKKYKTWNTMGDNKVRDSHVFMEGTRIGIDEMFDVNGSDMMFPGDTEHGAAPEEIINCRCWLTYS